MMNSIRHAAAAFLMVVSAGLCGVAGDRTSPKRAIPKTGDEPASREQATPRVGINVRPSHISSAKYITLLVDNLKSWPVDLPGREPEGYLQMLQRVGPQPMIEPGKVTTEAELRRRSPIQFVYEAARQDVVIADQRIPAGVLILVVVGAANRDPDVFDYPARFDIGCRPNPHLAFAHEVNFCLGAALAQLEAPISITEFFSRVCHFESMSTGPLEPRSALHVWSPESLPVRYPTTQSEPIKMEAYA